MCLAQNPEYFEIKFTRFWRFENCQSRQNHAEENQILWFWSEAWSEIRSLGILSVPTEFFGDDIYRL
jgi:hypothetical protein